MPCGLVAHLAYLSGDGWVELGRNGGFVEGWMGSGEKFEKEERGVNEGLKDNEQQYKMIIKRNIRHYTKSRMPMFKTCNDQLI